MIRHFAALAVLLLLSCAVVAQPVRPCVGELRSHIASASEDLFDIAKKYNIAVDHLAYANGFPITTLKVKAGTRLIIPTWRILPDHPPANGIVINLPERGVYIFRGGHFTRFFPISIGDEEAQKGRFATPTGNYKVIEKIKDPTWYPPPWATEKKPVGPGPDNPLGDRWIGLSLPRTGIHGTNQPLNVGNSVTHGCLRTYPDILHEIYNEIEIGWPAIIEYETAKVGKTASGEIVFVTFPDVYRRSVPLVTLKKRLTELGLTGSVKRRNFDSIAELCLGFPVEIANPKTVLDEVSRRLHWN